jgi:hypothetical protein
MGHPAFSGIPAKTGRKRSNARRPFLSVDGVLGRGVKNSFIVPFLCDAYGLSQKGLAIVQQ